MTLSDGPPAAASGDEPAEADEADEALSMATTATATENSPLLRSETASARTITNSRPDSPDCTDPAGADGRPKMSPTRIACLILGLWGLIFLQGGFVYLCLVGKIDRLPY